MSNVSRVKVLLDYMEEQGFTALECKLVGTMLQGPVMSVALVTPYLVREGDAGHLLGLSMPRGQLVADDDNWAATFVGYSKRPGTLHVVGVFESFKQVQPPLSKEKQDGPDEPNTPRP